MATMKDRDKPQTGDSAAGEPPGEQNGSALVPEVLDEDGTPLTDDELADGDLADELAGADQVLEGEELGEATDDELDDELDEQDLEPDPAAAQYLEDLDEQELDAEQLEDLAEPQIAQERTRTTRTDEGLDGAARFTQAQLELDGVIEGFNQQMMHKRRRGPSPKYRLRVFRRWPPEAQCYCPPLAVDLRQGLELDEIGEIYGGGVYDVQLMEGRCKVKGATWHGLPYGGEPILIPGVGRAPGQTGQILHYGTRQPQVYQPYPEQGDGTAMTAPGNQLAEAMQTIADGFRDAQDATVAAVERLEERIESARVNPAQSFTQSLQDIAAMKSAMEVLFPQQNQMATGEMAEVWGQLLTKGIDALPGILAGLKASPSSSNDSSSQKKETAPKGLRPIRVVTDDDDAGTGD